jgi:hypothetical protein
MASSDSNNQDNSNLSTWEKYKYGWSLLIIFGTIFIIFSTCKGYLMIRALRQAAAQSRLEFPPQPIEFRLMDLQPPQRAIVRRLSDASLAAPRYEEQMWDRNVPRNVNLELRGDRHYYVVKDERPPGYIGRPL